ncbi:MAG TPA: hypothetical protein VJB14_01780, partial [Planctomycetota bacterium]|nr:hypothetical protein [Planctomycetota bacterium]
MAKIGVALSGGGHRAALFGLGVLLYLADSGKNREVTSITSVSGGSLTNAWVGQEVDYATVLTAEFEEAAGRLARRIARRGTLWASAGTWIYLLVLALAVAAAATVLFLDLP